MQKKRKKEKLYAIMENLLEVQYHEESLLYLMTALDLAYRRDSSGETGLFANGVKYYLESLEGELSAVIHQLDNYIVEEARQK